MGGLAPPGNALALHLRNVQSDQRATPAQAQRRVTAGVPQPSESAGRFPSSPARASSILSLGRSLDVSDGSGDHQDPEHPQPPRKPWGTILGLDCKEIF
jgi:hypothetical protein